MVSRPGPLPSGPGWTFEVKWDGFRAVISTERGLCVRSRRGWGELVAWRGSEPYFRLVGRRILNGDTSIRLAYMIFDLLVSTVRASWSGRTTSAARCSSISTCTARTWNVAETFDDGDTGVCELGLEGRRAKHLTSCSAPATPTLITTAALSGRLPMSEVRPAVG